MALNLHLWFRVRVPVPKSPGRRREAWFWADPENGDVQVVKRRRTRRHRRNRLFRRWLAVAVLAVFIASASTVALRYFSPSLFRFSESAPAPVGRIGLSQSSAVEEIPINAQAPRPVYPYSVVPGGVENAKELKWVAEHDPVVAGHYWGFDFEYAQVVRLTLARTVYVS